jgi:hypothetical protein
MVLLTAGLGMVAGILVEPHLRHLTRDTEEMPVLVPEPLPPPRALEQTPVRTEQTKARENGLFLDNVLLALNTYGKPDALNGEYLEDMDALYDRLATLVQDDNPHVAEPATDVINILALMERTSDIAPVSEAPAIKDALEAVIANGRQDAVRSRAIDAWTRLYPPEQAMVDTLEDILQGDMNRFPETHAAAFRAYGVFRRRYGFALPDSTLASAKQLLAHPSQATRVKAEYAIAELGGTDAVPTLIAQLEQVGNSSEGRMLTTLILSLDDSRATRDALERIAAHAQ